MKKKIIAKAFTFIIFVVLSYFTGNYTKDDIVKIKEVSSPACTIYIPEENTSITRETLTITKTDTLYKNWMDTVGLVLLADTLAKDLVANLDLFKHRYEVDIKPGDIPGFQGAKIQSIAAFTMVNNNNRFNIVPVPKLNRIVLDPYPSVNYYVKYPWYKKLGWVAVGAGSIYFGYKIVNK